MLEEVGYIPKRKASCHGGEYSSPCPFCKDGDDRFIVHPKRHNKNGDYQGGRFSCRVCGKYGDAINFLRQMNGLSYQDACIRLRIEPKIKGFGRVSPRCKTKQITIEPPDKWKEKAKSFSEWSHAQFQKNNEGLSLLRKRGFTDESIERFCLGFNSHTFFREKLDWGLNTKEDQSKKIWLPMGITIPTFSNSEVIKVKIRRSNWKEGDKWPKYVEISGSKSCLSIYGDKKLPIALILESELDALLVQQEASDLIYCVALGGSTKQLDEQTDLLLRKTKTVLFLPDFDEAGAIAWIKWKKMFPHIQRILTPSEKSAGDYFLAGGNLREWLLAELEG